ncbi:MAG: hypothetical protein ACFCVG_15020 [Kineosporiaceae bacterium]
MREQSLRPRRGGLEHLAVPGHRRPPEVDATPAPGVAAAIPVPAGLPADALAPSSPEAPQGSSPATAALPPGPPTAGPDTEAVPRVPSEAPPLPARRRPRDRPSSPPWFTWLFVLLLAGAVMVAAGFAAGSIIRGLLPDADEAASGGVAGDAAAGAAEGEDVGADGISVTTVDPADLPSSWAGSELAPGRPAGPAYRWVDANGTTTLVLSVGTGEPDQVDATGSPAGEGTLFVTSVLGEGDAAEVQRQMREPVLCDGGSTSLRDGSVRVSDADGDGVAEVTTGWAVECPGEGEESAGKLSLLEGSDKYILRGPLTGGSPDPDPSSDDWPDGALDAAVQRYGEVFRG